MSQKRTHSLIEICLGTAIKFVLAMLVWQFIAAPIFDYQTTVGTSFYITAIFAVNSLVIGYFIRRAFNWITVRSTK